MIFGYYEDTDEVRERGYFGIQDTRKYPDNLMVNIPDIESVACKTLFAKYKSGFAPHAFVKLKNM